ncbi:MAG: hypothetical protein KDC71_24390, partial [Acidobacteria bacterium]|nr:hypothetical protein [Acidobacteriota bacterium]
VPDLYDPSSFVYPYAYARGNPVMFWDPDGKREFFGSRVKSADEDLQFMFSEKAQELQTEAENGGIFTKVFNVYQARMLGTMAGAVSFMANQASKLNYVSDWFSLAYSSATGNDMDQAYQDYLEIVAIHDEFISDLNHLKNAALKNPAGLIKNMFTSLAPNLNPFTLDPQIAFNQSKFASEAALEIMVSGGLGLDKKALKDASEAAAQEAIEAGIRQTRREAIALARLTGDLNEKVRILIKAGLSDWEWRFMVKYGVVCFTGETLVLTPEGHKRIDEIQKDDWVLAWSEGEGLVERQVMETFGTHPETVYRVTLREDSGQRHELRTTAEHPFYVVEEGAYLPVGDIQPGVHFRSQTGDSILFESIEPIRGPPTQDQNQQPAGQILSGPNQTPHDLSENHTGTNQTEAWTTYNFTVKDAHNYFVQDPNAPNRLGILVHNQGPKECTKISLNSGLPNLPEGYHFRNIGNKVQVVRNPGRAGDLPSLHLDNGVLKLGPSPGYPRSPATASAFLKQLDVTKYPKWMRPFLRKGETPVGFAVHHKKALFDGGTDTIENMVLQASDLHKLRHRFYRPGGRIPSINPP